MLKIDAIEVLLGILGIACSIYDPWTGDPRASILVTYARTASLCTVLGLVLLALATLIPLGVIEVDATIVAIVFFAIGGSAPTLTRGATFLVSLSTMFNQVVWLSYHTHLTGPRLGYAAYGITADEFVAWHGAVFWTLMKHNVTFQKVNSYGPELHRAFRYNWEAVVHGSSIHPGKTCWKHAWTWGCRGWKVRAEALLRIAVFNSVGFTFLLFLACAALGEGLLLAIGASWMSVAIAAQANGLVADGSVDRSTPLKLIVEELICCETCTHKDNNRPDTDNTKLYRTLMPLIKEKCNVDRIAHNNQGINVCRCRVCTLGCKRGWVGPDPCHQCLMGGV